ncbi:hypothetical protein Tco_1558817 [Tanacetum coccineum]
MVPATTSLTGFSGETIWPFGQLRLLVTIGDTYHSTRAWMNFMIVRSISPYNGIIGRPGIREIQAVPSTTHGNPQDKGAILSIIAFSEGELPVKYLGVPLISSRLLNRDCKVLVEKARNCIGD